MLEKACTTFCESLRADYKVQIDPGAKEKRAAKNGKGRRIARVSKVLRPCFPSLLKVLTALSIPGD